MTDERIIIPSRIVEDTPTSGIILTANAGVPTQVANPTRTTIRSVVQAVVGTLIIGVPLLNSILGALNTYLLEQEDVAVPSWVFLVLNGGLAVTALIIGAVARVMAAPGVADFISKHLPWLAPIKPDPSLPTLSPSDSASPPPGNVG